MTKLLSAARAALPLLAIVLLAACREAASKSKTQAAGSAWPEPALAAAFGTDGDNALKHPVWFGEVPGKPGAYLALERGGGRDPGRAVVLEEKAGKWMKKVFLSLPVAGSAAASDERGLLGIAFHPRFAENRRYFIYWMPPGDPDSTVVDERRADATLLADAGGKARRVIGIGQPYANHNGGTLAFGPKDGKLYIGTGDGGAGGDPQGHGQNLESLLGKMLRIDVDDTAGGRPYGIPADNPFVRGGGRPEIWAYGLRNPWKWSFDAETGELWAGDVGQNNREEIAVVGKGENHGWRLMEGFACYDPPRDCKTEGLTKPIVDLGRDVAESITGGYVYRGDRSSRFYGAYVFGDWETRIWWVIPEGHKAGEAPVKLGRLPDRPSSFGTDAKGNLYVVGYRKGVIYRLSL